MVLMLILAGLALLALGGELLVRGSVNSARVLGVSPLLIGLTLVGFGTSMPELVTSLFAAVRNAPGIAVGNVIGSNTANILLILGVSALISPLAVRPEAYRRESFALAASTLACIAAVLHGHLNQITGAALVGLLIAYIVWAYRSERSVPGAEVTMHRQMAVDAVPRRRGLGLALGNAAIGIAMTVLGARLLVDGAVALARSWGASETVVGLTVVALGTSLPELVACAVAAYRGHSDVALGNVIGSSIYNVLGILGLTAIVHPIDVPAEIARLDIWVLAGATAVLLLFLRTRWVLSRWEGGVFLAGYAGYMVYLVTQT
ncbi:MAG: calcium/sodium antiporter [Rhodanobacter sp.]|jgi:cation:H+ antiporter|nr:calcium/sodium antiporter [Rhodanobacter sp.]